MRFIYRGKSLKVRAAGYVFKRGIARDVPDKEAKRLTDAFSRAGIVADAPARVEAPAAPVAAQSSAKAATAQSNPSFMRRPGRPRKSEQE